MAGMQAAKTFLGDAISPTRLRTVRPSAGVAKYWVSCTECWVPRARPNFSKPMTCWGRAL